MALLKSQKPKTSPVKKWFIDWIKKSSKKGGVQNKNESEGNNLCKII